MGAVKKDGVFYLHLCLFFAFLNFYIYVLYKV